MPIYLITGGNRGIGLQLVSQAVADSSIEKVIVGIRDVTKPSDQLAQLVKTAGPSKIELVQIDSADFGAPKKALAHIDRLDVVIANAGIIVEGTDAAIKDIDPHSFNLTSTVNVSGVVALFQATYPLLEKSKASGGPQFTVIGSAAGIINSPYVGTGSYGASKAQLNWVVAAIAQEEKGKLVAYSIHPGLVDTDMTAPLDIPPEQRATAITPEVSAAAILKLVASDSEKTGKFLNYDGTALPYSL